MSNHLPPNPYLGQLTVDNRFRLNVEITDEDALFLKSISPRHGTIQTIISLYVKSLIIELRDANCTSYSDANLAKFRSVILGHTHPSLVGKDGESDDTSRKVGFRQAHTDAKDKPANVKSKVGERKSRGGKA